MDQYIDVLFTPSASVRLARSVYQYDHGLQLRIGGVSGTGTFQVHYSTQTCSEADVDLPVSSGEYWLSSIPDHILAQPGDITAYIYFYDEQSGQTQMCLTIPVTPRAKPSTYTADDSDLVFFDRIISDVNQAKEDVELATERLNGLTVSATQLDADAAPTAILTTENGQKNIAFGIPSGKPNIIKGSAYADVASLMASVPHPKEGDQYNVGVAPPYNVYRYTGSPDQPWENQGHLLGGMSKAEAQKLDTIDEYANNYLHPIYQPASSGLYKVAVDATGHVACATAVTKEDIVSLGIPSEDTTYANVSNLEPGLMSASDKGKLDGIEVGANLAPNRNLLDNWDFRNPVNQRGISTFTVGQYGLDRWMLGWGECEWSNGVLTLNGGLYQTIDANAASWPLNGKPCTVSVMLADGSIHSTAITPSASSDVNVGIPGIGGIGLLNTQRDDKQYKQFGIGTGLTVKIAAIKLELGTVSTLAQNAPMDYATALAKCQRYFFKTGSELKYRIAQKSGNNAWFNVSTPVEMRTIPIIQGPIIQGGYAAAYSLSAANQQQIAIGDLTVNANTRNGITLQAPFAYEDGFVLMNNMLFSSEL